MIHTLIVSHKFNCPYTYQGDQHIHSACVWVKTQGKLSSMQGIQQVCKWEGPVEEGPVRR